MGLFADSFDIDSYVRKRLMEMDDLQNRELFKEIIADMMCGIYRHVKEEYQFLEDRIFKETPLPERMPDIFTGLIPRHEYDVTDKYMRPMDAADLDERKISVADMLAALQNGRPFFLYTCFLAEDYVLLKKLAQEERIFHGIVETELGETTADFILRPNRQYEKIVENVYSLASLNYLPWRSINCPYLYKLFDVYALKVDWEEGDEIQEIRKITVELEEFAEKACHNPLPLWNLESVTLTANAYPQPALERGYYEHMFYRSQFNDESQYLLRHSDWNIRGIHREDGDLYILCDGETPGDWEFYEINSPPPGASYGYPLMSNVQRDSFSRNMIEHYGQRIKTRAELRRFITSFPCADILTLIDVQIVPHRGEKEESYSMEGFIDYEFRSGNRERALLASFRPQDANFFLNRDVMSFLMTGLQHYFPEYECVGQLV